MTSIPVVVDATLLTIVVSVSADPTSVVQLASEYRRKVALAAGAGEPARMPVNVIRSWRTHFWTVAPVGVAFESALLIVQVFV